MDRAHVHTHRSGRHVGTHVHGPGIHMALTHVQACARTWSEYIHMQGADTNAHVYGSRTHVHGSDIQGSNICAQTRISHMLPMSQDQVHTDN